MKKELAKIIAKAPNGPGIYQFLDEKGEPIYVGKAKGIKKRLQSYARASAKHGIKTQKMLEAASGVDWTETNSEVEALILEDNLVKTMQPRYNVLLKDDKTFQYIKVSVQDDYPEITTVRRLERDGAKYFGPKTSGTDVQRLLESVRRIFKLCSVRNITLDRKGEALEGAQVAVKAGGTIAKRPCLDYHIKRCTGPCAGIVTPEEYQRQIDGALKFLSGDYKEAVDSLKAQMMDFATTKKFERAAAIRDQIAAIEKSAEKQLITDTGMSDRDVIAMVPDLGKHYFVLFQVRAGRLIAQERFITEGGIEGANPDGDSPAEIMESFVRSYYSRAADIPKEVIISIEIPEKALLEDYITEQTGHTSRRTKLIYPQAGQKDRLIQLAEKNARSFAEQSRVRWMADERKGEKALAHLAKALKMQESPKRIECYDISHLGGTETIGSMVVFKKGEPSKADYRQFRLRSTANQNDDFKSMEEVITRRLNYLESQLPDDHHIRKAKKTDEDFILKTSPSAGKIDFDVKQFYIMEKGSGKKAEIVGFGRTHDLSDKVTRLGSVWISDKERGKKLGHFMMAHLIDKSKAKRLYLRCHKELEEYYLKFGWETLRQAPQEMGELDKAINKVTGNKKEPLFMAYQKKKKDISFTSMPDLMVIDGGKGQLSAAHDVLFSKGLSIPMISLAKREEEVFVPGRSEPLDIPKDSDASYLIQRLRDEAHRFAIEANRSSRDKKMLKSGLDDIPGVGPKLKKKLLTYFGSVSGVREASQVQLEQVVGEMAAKAIKEGFI